MKQFTRTLEDFACEHCGCQVAGNGYTNHCPRCLWSKHVDKNPGDRAETCHGLMEPIRVLLAQGLPKRIVHRCSRCKFERRNKVQVEDSFEALLELSSKSSLK